jgi:hypothetical protein
MRAGMQMPVLQWRGNKSIFIVHIRFLLLSTFLIFFHAYNGAYLASIHSVKENTFIWTIIHDLVNQSEFQSAWLDGMDTKQYDWNYTDGTTWKYTNWGQGQPDNSQENEHCLTMARAGVAIDGRHSV